MAKTRKFDVFVDNNPGNLRAGVGFQGEIGVNMLRGDRNGYATFKSLEFGVRAVMMNLYTYMRKHNLRTPRQIVSRYCAGTPKNEAIYYNFIVKRLNLGELGGPDYKIPWNKVIIGNLVQAIAFMEHSVELSDDMIEKGWDLLPDSTKKPIL